MFLTIWSFYCGPVQFTTDRCTEGWAIYWECDLGKLSILQQCHANKIWTELSYLPFETFSGVMGTPQPPQTPQNRVPGEQKIGQNDYNLVTRPPIKILRPLFTLQLLILPTRDPFQAQIS